MNRVLERVLPYRRPLIVIAHAALTVLAFWLAFVLRFDFYIPGEQFSLFLRTLPLLLAIRLIVFARFHLYQGLWRYISMDDVVLIIKATTWSELIFLAFVLAFVGHGFPRSVFVLDWILCVALIAGVRVGIRLLRESAPKRASHRGGEAEAKGLRAIVVGAGDAAEKLVKEIQNSLRLNYHLVGLVDDDPRKQRRSMHGVRVLGTIDELPDFCRSLDVDQVLVAIPSAGPDQRRRIMQRCRESGVPVKTVPTLREIFEGKRVAHLQEVQPEDLLRRKAVEVDFTRLLDEIRGRKILVTGAGGSIGSELCRQLAPLSPELLILFEREESSLYFTDVELQQRHPELKTVRVVGDILDAPKLEDVMTAYAPEVVYHAAAYKHVPLMEEHPLDAMQNNVIGTEILAQLAQSNAVRKFVFISTDKAVNPVGIMGMTKRVAENVLRAFDSVPTTFVSVRFGNVLGSNGSVLPLFLRQIAGGGPVTITDPEATRYFMLLAEAAQLVLQAGAMGREGEIYFLDMGEPISINSLAEDVIRLSGLNPGQDMPLQTVGLRIGERLREELVLETEELRLSEHDRIFVIESREFNPAAFREDLDALKHLVSTRNRDAAVEQLQAMAARY